MAGKIYTEDLSIFKKYELNREVDRNHVTQIIQSMTEGFYIPTLIVNDKMEVLDGQHRLEACRELGKPVEYEVLTGMNEVEFIISINRNTKDWDFKAFEAHYLKLAKDDPEGKYKSYQLLKEIENEYGIQSNYLLRIIAFIEDRNERTIMNKFEKGKFKFNNVVELTNFLSAIELFRDFNRYKTLTFMRAFASLYFNGKEEYREDVMKDQYEKFKHRLDSCSTMPQYQEVLINEMYANNKRIKLVFLGNLTKRKDKFALG